MTDYNFGDENGLHLMSKQFEVILDLDDYEILNPIEKVNISNCIDDEDLPF